MEMKQKSLKTTFLALTCFYFILITKCISLYSHSWYVLKIDLNKCFNCGRIIFTMGTLLEESLESLDDNGNVRDVSIETVQRKADIPLYGSITERNHVDTDDVYSSIFRIENEIHMYIGLWRTCLCTEDNSLCTDLDIDLAPDVFAALPLLTNIQENIISARQFFLLSTVIAVMTTFFATYNFTVTTSTTAFILSAGGLVSAFVSLTGIVIASLSLFEAFGMSDIVTVRVPLMLVTILLTDYITLMAVFSVWRTWEWYNKTSVQNWFERSIRKV